MIRNYDFSKFDRNLPSRKSPAPWQPFAIAGFLLGLFVGMGAVMVWVFGGSR